MTRFDRIELTYELAFQTPFHCGTGLRAGLIDRAVVRDAMGYLYVPGSSIKGALRMHCEGLARLYERAGEDVQAGIDSPHDTKKALWGMGNRITMVTRIFGSQRYPGRLFFDDARQSEEDQKQYDSRERGKEAKGKYRRLQTDLYTQVRLDRPTRTAVPGALYTSEFGTRDIVFQGNITGWLKCTATEDLPEQPTYSLLLLLAGSHALERLGGNKSTGKGRCRCNLTRVLINGEPCVEEQWKSWLDHLDKLSSYPLIAENPEEV